MSPSQARSLSEKHRKAQLVVRAATLRDLLKLWPAFNINDIKGSWDAFEEAVLLLVQARSKTSAGLATAYYRDLRRTLGVGGKETPRLVLPTTDEIVTGLRVVGPANAGKQLALGRPAATVARNTLVNLSGQTTRHVLNAGRKTVDASVMADTKAIGWSRVTSGNACSFCEMLASRGTVYKSETVDFAAHDHCSCFPEPSFR